MLQLEILRHIWKHFLLVDMGYGICNQLGPILRRANALLKIDKVIDGQPTVLTYYYNFYLIDALLKWKVMRAGQL